MMYRLSLRTLSKQVNLVAAKAYDQFVAETVLVEIKSLPIKYDSSKDVINDKKPKWVADSAVAIAIELVSYFKLVWRQRPLFGQQVIQIRHPNSSALIFRLKELANFINKPLLKLVVQTAYGVGESDFYDGVVSAIVRFEKSYEPD